jgi:hypothetical protein
MPRKEKLAKAKLAALISEQAKDAENGCILPERITPRKPICGRPPGITENEYLHLFLELSGSSREQIARFRGGVSPACVSQHLWSVHKKLGPEFTKKWKNISQVFKAQFLSLLASIEHLPPSISQEQEDHPSP